MKFIRLKTLAKNYLLPLYLTTSHLFAFEVGNIPVQSEGRIKPLDSFARNQLLRFYGKREVKEHHLTATDWLLNLILDPQAGKDLKIFNIRNPEVVSSLFLDWTNEHKYSYNEIIPGLKNQIELITVIDEKDDSDRSTFEKQLIELSHNAIVFEELSFMKNIKLIPPALHDENAVWQSPFDFIISGVTPAYHQEEILNSLQAYLAARFQENNDEMNNALAVYKSIIADLPISSLDIKKLKDETWMNEVDFLLKV